MILNIALGYIAFALVWVLLWLVFYKGQRSDASGDGIFGALFIMAIPIIPLLVPILVIGHMIQQARNPEKP